MSRLSQAVRKATARPAGPAWRGPAGDGPEGGVTQSLFGRYLSCKERFRLRVVDGWVPAPRFEPRLEFGNIWHAAEEAYANPKTRGAWSVPVADYCDRLRDRYLLQTDVVDHWYRMTLALFPEYLGYWERHPDSLNRRPLLAEHPFDVHYRLPSGRAVRLRGKWDGVDYLDDETAGGEPGVYLYEIKTKSQIDGRKIQRHLSFDLQTMFYLVALSEEQRRLDDSTVKARLSVRKGRERHFLPIRGVRYNVVRRPAHKSVESAVEKMGVDMRNGRAGEWFSRWNLLVSETDVHRFRRTCLDPLLENMLDDYEWWAWCFSHKPTWDAFDMKTRADHFPHHRNRHFRYPFGVYNPLEESGGSDLDALLDEGSTAGLTRAPTMFPELALGG